MYNRKFNINSESFDEYFADKVWLINNFEPTMSIRSKRCLIINGLENVIAKEVMVAERENSDKPLEELKETIDYMIRMMYSTQQSFEQNEMF